MLISWKRHHLGAKTADIPFWCCQFWTQRDDRNIWKNHHIIRFHVTFRDQMSVTVWPAKAKNLKFCTLLYHARKLDWIPFKTEFLFSWLEKLAYYLSWQEKQAQLSFGLSGGKLKKSKITNFFRWYFEIVQTCYDCLKIGTNAFLARFYVD